MLRSIIIAFSTSLFLTACQTGSTNLDGSFRLQPIGVTMNVALDHGFQYCASKGKNFDNSIDSLRSAGYTIKEPKSYSSKTETAAFDPKQNVNFIIIQNSKNSRRVCKIQFKYNSGLTSLPKDGPVRNGKTFWSLENLEKKLASDFLASPRTISRPRKVASGNEIVYTQTGNAITGKTFVHPDGYALGVINILSAL